MKHSSITRSKICARGRYERYTSSTFNCNMKRSDDLYLDMHYVKRRENKQQIIHYRLIHAPKETPYSSYKSNNASIWNQDTFGVSGRSTSIHYCTDVFLLFHWKIKLFSASLHIWVWALVQRAYKQFRICLLSKSFHVNVNTTNLFKGRINIYFS